MVAIIYVDHLGRKLEMRVFRADGQSLGGMGSADPGRVAQTIVAEDHRATSYSGCIHPDDFGEVLGHSPNPNLPAPLWVSEE